VNLAGEISASACTLTRPFRGTFIDKNGLAPKVRIDFGYWYLYLTSEFRWGFSESEQAVAQRVNVVLVDDIDGSDADETVTFAVDGTEYEIDLSSANAAGLRDALAPYVGHARRTGGRRRRGGSRGGNSRSAVTAAEIRAWARDNGWDVPDRGRVAAEVREAYEAAH
jgi:hypothetical protein